MTKPLPSLALDLSQDGIALHQLAFDGHWHELARVALNDPALRERLANMRAIASKLEGRRFKTRIWLPQDQILCANLGNLGPDEKSRLPKARSEIAARFGGKPKEYIVQLGKRGEGGALAVAAVRVSTLQEARIFARSHGFRATSFSTQAAAEGFATPPVFALPADKLRVVGLLTVAASAAAAVVVGGITFVTLDPLNLWESPPKVSDFAPFQRPNPAIEPAHAPDVPAGFAGAPEFPVFAGITTESKPSPVPFVPPRQLTAEAQTAVLPPALPSPDTAPEALAQASITTVNWPAPIAGLASPMPADPEPSIGLFSLQDRIAEPPQPETDIPPPRPSGPLLAYQPKPRPMPVTNTPFYLEPLPATATRMAQDELADFVTRSGLTYAQLSTMPAPLLLIDPKVAKVISGLPPILPRLRSGADIPAQVAPPPPPATPAGPAPLFALVDGKPDIVPPRRPVAPEVAAPDPALPFTLVSGAPDIRPPLRPVPAATPPAETEAPPDTPAVSPVAETPPSQAESLPEGSTPSPTGEAANAATAENDSLAAAVDAAVGAVTTPDTSALFAFYEGQPALLPRLRSGAEIAPIAPDIDPATAAANALRPLRRPQAIIDLPAPIDPMISGAAPLTAARPNHRNAGFATNVARIDALAANRPRVSAPSVPVDPQSVNLPTSASVARSATIENAINLRKTNLLGIFGTADNRTALIRLSNGRNIRVQQGDSFSGWTVVAIAENTVRLRKRNREEILRMPAE